MGERMDDLLIKLGRVNVRSYKKLLGGKLVNVKGYDRRAHNLETIEAMGKMPAPSPIPTRLGDMPYSADTSTYLGIKRGSTPDYIKPDFSKLPKDENGTYDHPENHTPDGYEWDGDAEVYVRKGLPPKDVKPEDRVKEPSWGKDMGGSPEGWDRRYDARKKYEAEAKAMRDLPNPEPIGTSTYHGLRDKPPSDADYNPGEGLMAYGVYSGTIKKDAIDKMFNAGMFSEAQYAAYKWWMPDRLDGETAPQHAQRLAAQARKAQQLGLDKRKRSR